MRQALGRTGVQATLVGVVSALALGLVEWLLTQFASDSLFAGYRFQAWSSEEFMQEVHINDLLDVGPIGLWYLHVQPPGLESLRFLLAVPNWLTDELMTAQMIDQRMYAAYVVLYGVLNALVFTWLKQATRSTGWALSGAVLFALYPGTLAMATLLDGTFPSAVIATAQFLLLYLALRDRSVKLLNWWLVSLVALSLTRTIFQLQILVFIPFVVWAIYRWRMPVRRTAAVVLSAVLVGMLFALPAKQFMLYRTTATTSFGGNHQIEVVSYRPTPEELAAVEVPQDIIDTAQNFVSGFNSPENIRLNYVLSQVGNQYYMNHPMQVVKNLIWGIQMNTAQAFKFTHEYSSVDETMMNALVATLPWTPPMVNGISVTFYLLVLFVTAACLLYAFGTRGLLKRAKVYWPMLLMLGLAMITFLLANRYDWSEADRLKFIVEPVFAVLFFSSLKWALDKRRATRSAAIDEPATATVEG